MTKCLLLTVLVVLGLVARAEAQLPVGPTPQAPAIYAIPAPFSGGGPYNSALLAPTTPTGCTTPSALQFQGDPDTGIGYNSADQMLLCAGGVIFAVRGGANGIYIPVGSPIQFNDDVQFVRGTAGRINVQSTSGAGGESVLRVSNLANDATSRGAVQLVTANSGNVWQMFARAGALFWGVSSVADYWGINTSGHWIAATDNTYDLGTSGALRPRSIYVGTSFIAPSAGNIRFESRAQTTSNGDGLWNVLDNSGSFGLQFNVGTAAPTVASGGGGSPAIQTGSRNAVGAVDVGTGGVATQIVINFGAPNWTNAPRCVAWVETGTAGNVRAHGVTTTASAMTITAATAWVANAIVAWQCEARI